MSKKIKTWKAKISYDYPCIKVLNLRKAKISYDYPRIKVLNFRKAKISYDYPHIKVLNFRKKTAFTFHFILDNNYISQKYTVKSPLNGTFM